MSFIGFFMECLYCKVAGIEVNEVVDGFVCYDPSNESVHFLNHTAMIIWELCTGETSSSDIINIMRELYKPDMPLEDIVRGALMDMVAKGLIIPCPA